MTSCRFCNIESLNQDVFFRGINSIGIITNEPFTYGHVLVITQKHYVDFLDIPFIELPGLMQDIQNIIKKVKLATGCEGYNILINNGPKAGQTIGHLHIHVIPRHAKDEITVIRKPFEFDKDKRMLLLAKLIGETNKGEYYRKTA